MTTGRRQGSRLRRAARIGAPVVLGLLGVLAALKGLQELGGRVPVIEPTGAEVVRGPLTLRPIRFAQDDFFFYPSRVEAEEGRLRVPAIHGGATAATLEIRFVRFPSTSREPARSPVVYLAGGPGGSGVATAAGDRFPFFQKLREAGDVIALDQRGAGAAEPSPICPGAWAYPPDRAYEPEGLARAREPVLRECWEHWSGSLPPAAFTTVESAEDLEDLRVALGAERLNLVGISYGTHLALAYIRRHPDRVGRAVLAGVEGPDHTYKSPALVDAVVEAIDRALESEAGRPGFLADLRRAVDRLARERPRVTVTDRRTGQEVEVALGPLDLKTAAFYGLGEREDFLEAARRVRRIAEGDDALLAAFALRLRAGGSPAVMPLSMDCASGVSPERRQRLREEQATALIGEVANLGLETTCPFWPVEDLGDDYRSPISSQVEVLAVSGTLDLRTPPANADEVLAGFPAGGHLLIVGGGHGDDLLIASPRIAEAMVRFLRTGDPGRKRVVLPSL